MASYFKQCTVCEDLIRASLFQTMVTSCLYPAKLFDTFSMLAFTILQLLVLKSCSNFSYNIMPHS